MNTLRFPLYGPTWRGAALACLLAGGALAQAAPEGADPLAADPFAADPFAAAADPFAAPADDFRATVAGERVVLRALNKVTAHTEDFTVGFDAPLEFGSLTVLARYCSRRPPELIPETFVFLEIHDRALESAEDGEIGARVFGGWMLGSSPALHGLEHPVYDIWPVACIVPGDAVVAAETAEAEAEAAQQRREETAEEEEVFLD